MFVLEMPTVQTCDLTGRARATVVNWYEYCCTVCTAIIAKKPQMVGTEESPIHIDESHFAGRQKYNCGRILNGYVPPLSEDNDAEVENKRNHGARVDGSWVFGL